MNPLTIFFLALLTILIPTFGVILVLFAGWFHAQTQAWHEARTAMHSNIWKHDYYLETGEPFLSWTATRLQAIRKERHEQKYLVPVE